MFHMIKLPLLFRDLQDIATSGLGVTLGIPMLSFPERNPELEILLWRPNQSTGNDVPCNAR